LPIRRSAGVLDPIKYIRLRARRNDWFLPSAEARQVWEQIGNDNWGTAIHEWLFNQRYMLYFDVHYGKHVRTSWSSKAG